MAAVRRTKNKSREKSRGHEYWEVSDICITFLIWVFIRSIIKLLHISDHLNMIISKNMRITADRRRWQEREEIKERI